ncbi:hypothetical protein BASA60_000926 [Batrachochytrium salamandrivorans]|nr:hypothetical protein BASA60_000926 [Batrachochytrium salamandrivorans]
MEQHHLLLQKQLHDSQQHQQQHQQQQHQQQQHIPHNQHFVPLSPKYKYPSSPFRRPQNTQAIQSDPSTPLANTLYPLQQSPISTSNRGSTHSSSPCPLPGINTLASLDFKTSHHPQPLSHEAPNSTDPADADHCPNSKRSVWTDITHRVFQSPLPSVPTPSCLEAKLLLRTLPRGKMGTVVYSSSSQISELEFLVNLSSALSFQECPRKNARII